MDPQIARLLDERDIERVIYSYCRGIDRHDLDRVRACYHPDATDDHGSFSGGVEEYIDWVDGLLARYDMTLHFVANILIDFSEDTDLAAVESYGVALHRSPEGKAHLNLATAFRYVDRFERRNGAWKIARRVAVSEGSLRIPKEAWWEIPDSFRQGKRDASDEIFTLLARVGVQTRGDT